MLKGKQNLVYTIHK